MHIQQFNTTRSLRCSASPRDGRDGLGDGRLALFRNSARETIHNTGLLNIYTRRRTMHYIRWGCVIELPRRIGGRRNRLDRDDGRYWMVRSRLAVIFLIFRMGWHRFDFSGLYRARLAAIRPPPPLLLLLYRVVGRNEWPTDRKEIPDQLCIFHAHGWFGTDGMMMK